MLVTGRLALLADAVAQVLEQEGFPVRRAHEAGEDCAVAALVGATVADVSEAADARAVVVVLATEPTQAEAIDLLAAGADAVLHADDEPTVLADAVATVGAGGAVVDPRTARAVLRALRRHRVERASVVLSPREASVLECIAKGESVKQAARTLGVSRKTVENVQTALYRKLGARNRAHALMRAVALGLVPGAIPPGSGGGNRGLSR